MRGPWGFRVSATGKRSAYQSATHSAAAAFCAIPCLLSRVERGTPFLLTEHGVYLRERQVKQDPPSGPAILGFVRPTLVL